MEQNSESAVSGKEMEETIKAEIDEIEKYKWYLGERIGHDPLTDRSMNDICNEWIEKHSQAFRKYWDEVKKNLCS
ncbi:MAG TPA: hypothetical protein VKF42_07300 [Chitinivibrionales bacterium]|jgi:hypothetical protein|nr:hypothetical protein [Chitinivibrionales bacterium]